MKLKAAAKKALMKLDQFSPRPIFYPFIMSRGEKAVFDETIKRASHYLEFGMGGSTLRAIQKSDAVIYTVESSPGWVAHMRGYASIKRSEKTRLHIFPVEIGPVGNWGYPTSDDFKDRFESYSSEVFRSINPELVDLALIDGRFRVACALKVILECHANKRIEIMVHDFWERSHYHLLLRYLDVVKRIDSLALFSIKQDVDLNLVKKDYDEYKFKPA